MIEGITRQLVVIADLPEYNDYSTVNRRVNRLDVKLDLPSGMTIVVGGDGTGFQAISGGEYMRQKYGKKNRKWIQVIILGDPETKEPVSFEVNIVSRSEADSVEEQIEDLIGEGVDIKEFGSVLTYTA